MANLTELKSNVLSNIAAIQTLLEKYPVLIKVDSLRSIIENCTSFDFMFDILKVLGVDQEELLLWASNLIVGNGTNGLLDVVEDTIKTALKANISNMISCSVNPIIPDDLLDRHQFYSSNGLPVKDIYTEGSGIEIDLTSTDYTGILKNCPTDSIGKYFYFDNEFTTSNDLYMSKDFNAFLWYVINKGVYANSESRRKMIWDNRVNAATDENYVDFFSTKSDTEVKTYNLTHSPKKKQIIQCQFVERGLPRGNQIKVQLCSSEYFRTRKIANNVYVNKTLMEFNSDYIDSLKLFDSKVLVAQIIDNLTGALAVHLNYSINEIVAQGKIGEIIKKIIESDDTSVSNCYYTFSNDEYDKMLNVASLKHAGLYKFEGDSSNGVSIDTESILNSLSGFTSGATLNETVNNIKNSFTEVSATLAQDTNVSISDSFNFGTEIIYQLISQIMASIISAVLSPKVVMLFVINLNVMGQTIPSSFDEFLEGINNMLVALVKEIKDKILEELYKFLIKTLEPLMVLYSAKLVLESVTFYKEILENLYKTCILSLR